MPSLKTEKAMQKVMEAVRAKRFGSLTHSANDRSGNVIMKFIDIDGAVIATTSTSQIVGKRYPRRKKAK